MAENKTLVEVRSWVFTILRILGLAAQVAATVSDNPDVQKAGKAGKVVDEALPKDEGPVQ